MAADSGAGVRARAIHVSATAQSRAPAATVFALLKDGTTWPSWTMFDAFELERPGKEEPMGLGAIRVFSTALTRSREETVELVPDRRLSYALLSGFPFTGYRADVDLSPGRMAARRLTGAHRSSRNIRGQAGSGACS
jgi:hypothetical protein